MDINEIIRQVTEEICAKYGTQVSAPQQSGGMNPADMAKYIDHTFLKPEASVSDIRKICDEVRSITAQACASIRPISSMSRGSLRAAA